MSACRRVQIGPYLSHYTKLKAKQIKVLNIKSDTMNLREEKVGNSFAHSGTGENFFNRASILQAIRSPINKCHLMKLKSFGKAKETIKITKWQVTEW